MTENKQCPNCGQYKVVAISPLDKICYAIFLCAILIITLPIAVLLVPVALIAAFMPEYRRSIRTCRNCQWTDKTTAITPQQTG